MNKNTLVVTAVAALAVAAVTVAFVDRPLAELIHASGYENATPFARGTAFFDAISGKNLSKFLLGGVLLAAGVALLAAARTRRHGWMLLFVGIVQTASTLATGTAKNVFGRLRPYELLAGGEWEHAWFAGGSAFPSGHTGFYFGLFLPLALLFPRWRWPLLIVPAFIAVARIVANDHFLADVSASIALAALLTLAAAAAMRRVLPQRP